MKLLYDTNILIDYLNGVPEARPLLDNDPGPSISLITWMEVLVGASDEAEKELLRRWLAGFWVLPVDHAVATAAVELRRQHRIRLPDAIILASADTQGWLLATRNTRDFPEQLAGIHVPYRL